jgi:mRNA interferase MazF
MSAGSPGRPVHRGEIYYAAVSPGHAVGSEQHGKRPWLVVSSNAINQRLPIVQAVPLSSKLEKATGHPYRILVPRDQARALPGRQGLSTDSIALTEQLRALAKDRLEGDPVARATPAILARVEIGIRFVLGMA